MNPHECSWFPYYDPRPLAPRDWMECRECGSVTRKASVARAAHAGVTR